MDGLSIANTGAVNEQTSAEYANKVEQAIASDPTNSSQLVQGTNNNKRVKEKDENEGSNKQNREKPNSQEEFQDGYAEEPNEETQDFDIEDFENPDKEFYVKLNMKDDIIELYDSSSDRLIETISGNELGELVQRLNMASGIFVNKKV